MSPTTTSQEAVMGQPFPNQHPAVVLRSHFNFVRALLAVAMAAVVALSVTVVIVANDNDEIAAPSAAQVAPLNTTVHAHPQSSPLTRYDGGPEEGTRGATNAAVVPNGARYDGGPEEGSASGITSAPGAPGASAARYDGGPEEGSSSGAITSEPQPTVIPQGPGAR
jgi:hypothetical protein